MRASYQTVWRTVKLLLHDKNLHEDRWEMVLPEAFHAVRSLACLATNERPHERLFRFSSRAMTGKLLPSWLLIPRPVLLRRFVRRKDDPLTDDVEIVEANLSHAVVRFSDGRESSVSTSDLTQTRRVFDDDARCNQLESSPDTSGRLRMATLTRRRLIALQRLPEMCLCAGRLQFVDPRSDMGKLLFSCATC